VSLFSLISVDSQRFLEHSALLGKLFIIKLIIISLDIIYSELINNMSINHKYNKPSVHNSYKVNKSLLRTGQLKNATGIRDTHSCIYHGKFSGFLYTKVFYVYFELKCINGV
jgi:hypothetical protein